MFFKATLQDKACRRDYIKYAILLFLGVLIRLAFAYLFKGHGDPSNLESYNEYLIDGQIPIGIPYFPSIYVFGYIFGVFVDHFGLFYSFWMRLADIFADIGIMFLLFKITRQMGKSDRFSLFVCAAYIFNPMSFQLTALHGQFDQQVFFFILLAVYIELSHSWAERHKNVAIPLTLLLATYFKPYVIFCLPAFFFKRPHAKDKRGFLLIYILGCILPFLLLLDQLLIIRSIRSMLGYSGGGHLGWGIPFFELATIGDLIRVYAKFSKFIIIISAVIIGYVGRKTNILALLLITILVVYILSPVLASQYLYWVIPIGVIFIDKLFCLYSVLGFIWQLNFSQYLIFETNQYANYHQFVPLTSMKSFYNYWLYPECFVKSFHFIGGVALLPALILIWLVSLVKKSNFLVVTR